MPLEFDTARVSVPVAPQRTDITCFVGYVRTRNTPLPRQVTEDLRAAGWIDGPWRRSEAQVRTLEQLPVVVESWDAFDQIFDWLEKQAAMRPFSLKVEYDPTLGYPLSVDLVPVGIAIDGNVQLRVSGVKALN